MTDPKDYDRRQANPFRGAARTVGLCLLLWCALAAFAWAASEWL